MKIEHVALYVKDLEGARKFFEKYFCAKSGGLYHNRTSDFKSYFLTFDGGASRYNPVMLLKVNCLWTDKRQFRLQAISSSGKRKSRN